jgi:hypothetical protein
MLLSNDELDKLAATEVMGFVWSKIRIGDTDTEIHGYCLPGEERKKLHHRWQPTRNIAQAWEMLDKFPEFRIDQEEGPKYLNVIIWDKGEMYYGTADTAPLAIVRACLKAKGVSVE